MWVPLDAKAGVHALLPTHTKNRKWIYLCSVNSSLSSNLKYFSYAALEGYVATSFYPPILARYSFKFRPHPASYYYLFGWVGGILILLSWLMLTIHCTYPVLNYGTDWYPGGLRVTLQWHHAQNVCTSVSLLLIFHNIATHECPIDSPPSNQCTQLHSDFAEFTEGMYVWNLRNLLFCV